MAFTGAMQNSSSAAFSGDILSDFERSSGNGNSFPAKLIHKCHVLLKKERINEIKQTSAAFFFFGHSL
jgi:hypothetical protein